MSALAAALSSLLTLTPSATGEQALVVVGNDGPLLAESEGHMAIRNSLSATLARLLSSVSSVTASGGHCRQRAAPPSWPSVGDVRAAVVIAVAVGLVRLANLASLATIK